MRKVCFIHYFGTEHAAGIFTEIADALLDSGLFNALDRLHLGLHGDPCYGPSVLDLSRLSAKLTVHAAYDEQPSSGESATLMLIRDHVLRSAAIEAICYLHTKGATNNSEVQQAWRQYMLDFVVFCWRNAEYKLSS